VLEPSSDSAAAAADRTPDPLQLLAQVRAAGGSHAVPGMRIALAEAFGFCQGVGQAVARALAAARLGQPDKEGARRLWMTGEIIHNPSINEALRHAGIALLPPPGTPGRLAAIRPEDRVIVPAFGIEIEEEEELRRIGCQVVDTTCGWVRRVWKTAHEFSSAGLTIVIHGRREHEETRATASRVPGPWIIVRDRAGAERLAAWVRRPPGGFPPEAADMASSGFDPARDLTRLGIVNQTTMLSAETQEIAQILRYAVTDHLGAPPGIENFRVLDTFCPATQERQNAVRDLLARERPDLLLVVGGFRSSNTAHLARIGQMHVPTFHVEDAGCLLSRERLRHLPQGAREPVESGDWLPPAPRTIAVTAGASTPDSETGRILARLLDLHHRAPAQARGAQ
jgi:4-hydroxy-3-methylbut-2-enyl diphosphate reductase